MKAILSFLILFCIHFSIQAQQVFDFDESLFDNVLITHASGKLHIQNLEAPGFAQLKTLNAVSNKDCDSYYEIKNRTLTITTEKKLFVLKSDCTQAFIFRISHNKKIAISLGVGDIHFHGLFSTIAADLGSGHISVQGKVANLDLNVATGSVAVSGLDGYGKITLLSGDLDIKYKAPKKKFNQLFVSKSKGNTSIQIPKGSKAESKLKTLFGEISNSVSPSRKGQFYFSVQTKVGDIQMNNY